MNTNVHARAGIHPPRADADGKLKRVLYIMALDPRGKFGSLEEQVLVLARTFRDRGSLLLPVFLCPLDDQSAAQYAEEGLSHAALDLHGFSSSQSRTLLRLVRENRIDVVHWNFYHPVSNPYVWLLGILAPRVEQYYTDHISRPVGTTGPSNAGWLKSALKDMVIRRYDKIVCVSDFIATQREIRRGPRPFCVRHFINTERFRPDAAARREVRQALGVDDRFVAVLVAHLIKEKGVDVAIRAMAELPPEVVLWVIGQGREETALRALADDQGLGDRVRFLGPQRFVQTFMQAADCAVCPSLWAEAAGLVNLEGPACGLPVVASRIGGIPEFIEDGVNGYLFTPGDHRQLAALVRRLMADEPARRVMAERARITAVDRYSVARRMHEHLEIYDATPTVS